MSSKGGSSSSSSSSSSGVSGLRDVRGILRSGWSIVTDLRRNAGAIRSLGGFANGRNICYLNSILQVIGGIAPVEVLDEMRRLPFPRCHRKSVEEALQALGVSLEPESKEERLDALRSKLSALPGIIGECAKCNFHLGVTSAVDTCVHDLEDEESKDQIAESLCSGCSDLVDHFEPGSQQDADEAMAAMIHKFKPLKDLFEFNKTTLFECDRCGWSRFADERTTRLEVPVEFDMPPTLKPSVKKTFARKPWADKVHCEKCGFYTDTHNTMAIVPNDPTNDKDASGSGPAVLMVYIERGQRRTGSNVPVFSRASGVPVARNVIQLDRWLDPAEELTFRVKGQVKSAGTAKQQWAEADWLFRPASGSAAQRRGQRVAKPELPQYELVASIVHTGRTLRSGHWRAFVKRRQQVRAAVTEDFYLFDDLKVPEKVKEVERSGNDYLAFYRRVGGLPRKEFPPSPVLAPQVPPAPPAKPGPPVVLDPPPSPVPDQKQPAKPKPPVAPAPPPSTVPNRKASPAQPAKPKSPVAPAPPAEEPPLKRQKDNSSNVSSSSSSSSSSASDGAHPVLKDIDSTGANSGAFQPEPVWSSAEAAPGAQVKVSGAGAPQPKFPHLFPGQPGVTAPVSRSEPSSQGAGEVANKAPKPPLSNPLPPRSPPLPPRSHHLPSGGSFSGLCLTCLRPGCRGSCAKAKAKAVTSAPPPPKGLRGWQPLPQPQSQPYFIQPGSKQTTLGGVVELTPLTGRDGSGGTAEPGWDSAGSGSRRPGFSGAAAGLSGAATAAAGCPRPTVSDMCAIANVNGAVFPCEVVLKTQVMHCHGTVNSWQSSRVD